MTTRTIPAALQTHLNGTGTTLCYLLKITGRDGTVLGVTSLDQDVSYDDGYGSVTYQAAIGTQQSALATTDTLEVDNSEATMLLADSGDFTQAKIEAGALDFAEFVIYRVNWQDLSMGHYVVQTGTTGVVRSADGLAGVVELRGLPQLLKQSFVELYSITCRARFGSGNTGGCAPGYNCNFDAESLWQSGAVGSVGSETDRIFTATAVPAVSYGSPATAYSFVPGLLEWLTGDNTGATSEVEAFDLAGTSPDAAIITLRFGTPYTITAGDTFQIRPDCDKTWDTCKNVYNNVLNFRGEPLIPLGDESSMQTPGAQSWPIFSNFTLGQNDEIP